MLLIPLLKCRRPSFILFIGLTTIALVIIGIIIIINYFYINTRIYHVTAPKLMDFEASEHRADSAYNKYYLITSDDDDAQPINLIYPSMKPFSRDTIYIDDYGGNRGHSEDRDSIEIMVDQSIGKNKGTEMDGTSIEFFDQIIMDRQGLGGREVEPEAINQNSILTREQEVSDIKNFASGKKPETSQPSIVMDPLTFDSDNDYDSSGSGDHTDNDQISNVWYGKFKHILEYSKREECKGKMIFPKWMRPPWIRDARKSEQHTRQMLLCKESGGGELCRIIIKSKRIN